MLWLNRFRASSLKPFDILHLCEYLKKGTINQTWMTLKQRTQNTCPVTYVATIFLVLLTGSCKKCATHTES